MLSRRYTDTPQELVDGNADPIIYLAGSAMGLQPRAVMTRTKLFLDQWASQAIHAGFTTLPDCEVPSWLKAEQEATGLMTPIVGAQENEVVLMGTLTANLHLVMATFYRPAESSDKRRTKIMIEEGVFSSDLVSLTVTNFGCRLMSLSIPLSRRSSSTASIHRPTS